MLLSKVDAQEKEVTDGTVPSATQCELALRKAAGGQAAAVRRFSVAKTLKSIHFRLNFTYISISAHLA